MAEWMQDAEVARLLGISPRTLANWRGRGEGPAFSRAGRRALYAREEVDRWLLSQQQAVAAAEAQQ